MAVDPLNVGPASRAVQVAWAANYVGLPFRSTGFDRDGLHCWGLVCLVFQQELGIELPRYGTVTAKDLLATARIVGLQIKHGPWLPVIGGRRSFDVVLMSATVPDGGRLVRVPSHCGVAFGPELILHIERGIDSVCVSHHHPTIRHRILGTYRYECPGHAQPQPV